MADNFNITEGVGTAVRAVEKSSKKTQVVALDLGGAGAESLLTTTLPVSGTVTANLGATDNAVLDSILAKLSSDPATQTTLAAILAKLTADPATQTTLAALLAKFASGTVIGDVNLGATDNAVLDTIDAVLDAINAKLVTGTVIGDVNLGATDNAVLDAAVAVLGATSGAAVITDANGTIQQYLRGLVKLAIDTTPSNVVLTAGTALAGKVGIDQVTANANEVVIKSGTLTAVTGITNALPAGTNLLGKTQPFAAMIEGGLTELVGINEQIDQNDYSGSIGVSLGGTYSGEILSIALFATEDGTGAVQDSAGILYILDADPSIASGDTAMSAAARVTLLGKIAVAAADWDVDANGGCAFITTQPIPFHALANLYFVWKHLDATALNDGAGDDEQLEFNFWYKRES